MRLNKFIAHNSHYSRRKADELIKEGKVKINHTVTTEIFVDVKPEDRV
jgi:23S rRNA pseudouridine2605 synthase